MAAEAEEEVRLELEAVYGDDHRMVRDFPPPHLVVHVHPRTADDSSQQMDNRKLKRRKMLHIGSATYVVACMIVLLVRSRLRNSMATGKIAKGTNDPIGTDVNEILDDETAKALTEDKGKRAAGHGSAEEVTMSTTCGGDTSASKPPKRAKISTDDDMYAFMTTGIERLAKAIEKAGTAETDVPEDLWDNMMDLPGFEEVHLAHYYAHLCENVSLARAFNKLSFSNKLVWVARYISNNNL